MTIQNPFKGTVSRDFLLQVFFTNHLRFFASGFFHESSSPKPLKIKIISYFSKVMIELYGLRQSASYWYVLAMSALLPSSIQIRKFIMLNLKISNPQIFLVSQSANLKSANYPNLHWFASNSAILLINVSIFWTTKCKR
jgi:hypothetical protein